jgi:internalin A
VRHVSGTDSPLLVVQTRCDRVEDEKPRAPVEDALLEAFAFRRPLHYSALNDRGRGALDDALRQAVRRRWEGTSQARIGKGRLAVKRRLEALRNQDADMAPAERKYRTLTQAFFQDLCEEIGGVSSPEMFLDYLHQVGIVFYRKGLFDDRIVLGQAWALEAVYAVFNRERCYKQLLQLKGRFNRTLLEALVWSEYGAEQQAIFLSLMTSCGVCFEHRPGDPKRDLEAEYIAPDLLPHRNEVEAEIDAMWSGPAPVASLVVEIPFLHPGVMRSVISRIGREAGFHGLYWKYGACLYEKTTRSHALIEQEILPSATRWSGRLTLSTRGGQSAELLGRLRKLVEEELRRSGCREWMVVDEAALPPGLSRVLPPLDDKDQEPAEAPLRPALEFATPPAEGDAYCVSYAWNDASKKVVDDLCRHAEEERKVKIVRDTTGLGLGESITKFMRRLGAGDRVFVVLSDKYLKSPYCMYELLEVWRNCKHEGETFRRRVRVYRLPDAAISRAIDRLRYARYWMEQFEEMDQSVRKLGPSLMANEDFGEYRLMLEFAHHVGPMLREIADTLQPADFESFVKYCFQDPPAP